MSLPRALIVDKLLKDLAELRTFAEELEAFPELAAIASDFHRACASAAMTMMAVAEQAIGDARDADEACAEAWTQIERARVAWEGLRPAVDRVRAARRLPRRPVPVRPRTAAAPRAASELYAAILRSTLRP